MSQELAQKKVEPRRIEVVLFDDSTSYFVSPQALDVLLENNRVMKFKRSNGWATVGIDPVRIKCSTHFPVYYGGPERRISN